MLDVLSQSGAEHGRRVTEGAERAEPVVVVLARCGCKSVSRQSSVELVSDLCQNRARLSVPSLYLSLLSRILLPVTNSATVSYQWEIICFILLYIFLRWTPVLDNTTDSSWSHGRDGLPVTLREAATLLDGA